MIIILVFDFYVRYSYDIKYVNYLTKKLKKKSIIFKLWRILKFKLNKNEQSKNEGYSEKYKGRKKLKKINKGRKFWKINNTLVILWDKIQSFGSYINRFGSILKYFGLVYYYRL